MLPIIIVVFFTSCTEIYYPAPQPEFAEELTEIPEKFQGEFWRVNSIMNDTIIDSKGIFYVIHPSERDFIRNISGSIVSIKGKDNFICFHGHCIIILSKYHRFFR